MDQDNTIRQKYISTHMTLQLGLRKRKTLLAFSVEMHEGLNWIFNEHTHADITNTNDRRTKAESLKVLNNPKTQHG